MRILAIFLSIFCSTAQFQLHTSHVSNEAALAARKTPTKRRAGDSSLSESTPPTRQRGDASCNLLATPNDDIIKMIVDDINSVEAEGYVGAESPSLTNKRIMEVLIAAAQKGARVKIFVNDHRKENFPETLEKRYEDLRQHRISLTELPNLHAKRIVIKKNSKDKDQDKVIYLGSLNMTENSPYNHEIMMRCTDQALFTESFGDQQRLGKPFYNRPTTGSVDFTTRHIVHSSDPRTITAQTRAITEFEKCTHLNDYLYFAAYTLDDPEIVNALIHAKQTSDKPIKVIVDRVNWQKNDIQLEQFIRVGIEVYVFNKNGNERTPQGYPKSMHIKAILRQCNQQCLSLVSTANFTRTRQQDINHDLWEPCSPTFSEQLKKILDNVIQESDRLKESDFHSLKMGRKLLGLMRSKREISRNTSEILRLIEEGADLTLTDAYGATALIHAADAGHIQIVQELLNTGAQVDTKDRAGYTAFLRAFKNNDIPMIQTLAHVSANLNIPNPTTGRPALIDAIARGNMKLIIALLEAGANVNAKDREGKTAFDYATKKPEILNLLNNAKFARENIQKILPEERGSF